MGIGVGKRKNFGSYTFLKEKKYNGTFEKKKNKQKNKMMRTLAPHNSDQKYVQNKKENSKEDTRGKKGKPQECLSHVVFFWEVEIGGDGRYVYFCEGQVNIHDGELKIV